MGVTGVQKRLLPVRVGQVDVDGLEAERPDPGQRALDVGDDEVEVVRAGPAGGQEALQEGRVCCQSMASRRYTIPGQTRSTSSAESWASWRSADGTMALEWLRRICLALT